MRRRMVLTAVFAAIAMFVGVVTASAQERVLVFVDVSIQTMAVFVDGQHRYTWPVSTARAGKVTPRGVFTPYWLHANHFSSLYNNAPMPYSVFYSGNYAVHGTYEEAALGSPASAGCVRLSVENARIFYRLVEEYGMEAVRITIQ